MDWPGSTSKVSAGSIRRLSAHQTPIVVACSTTLSTYGKPIPGLTHGQAFFRSFRDLTATGFWTTKMGFADIGYIGNTVVPKWDGCPPEQLKKLGL